MPAPSEVRELAGAIRSLPRKSDLPVKDAFRNGMIAGGILRAVIANGITLTKAKADMADRFGMQSPKRIDNFIWAAYRSVAHLWSAYLDAGTPADLPSQVVCEPVNLGRFLIGAETYRRRGERTKSAPKGGTVLAWGQAVKLPNHVVLPKSMTAAKI
jgi:hypothetical protein